MDSPLQLVEVTGLAQNSGFEVDPSIERIGHWFRSADFANGDLVRVYFTQLLWNDLGGSSPDQQAFDNNASAVFAAARKALAERIISQNSWRTSFRADWQGRTQLLWLVLNHRQSDGVAIGFGPGDFW